MVVDDHASVRRLVTRILAAEPDIEVVADCAGREQAVRVVADAHPQVILMDLAMPGMDGAAAAAQILHQRRDIRIWLHTATPQDPRIDLALAAGAVGVLPKSGDPRAMLAAVRSRP
ncbi:response regulator [Pseudonocardia sp. GCM10023141]|uniref:response regulator n=1 Tax=Pseudonocardia sp. GCM10023141 TaxID=3252653 RepID=UPI0036186971